MPVPEQARGVSASKRVVTELRCHGIQRPSYGFIAVENARAAEPESA